jgi:SnoaL-like domain
VEKLEWTLLGGFRSRRPSRNDIEGLSPDSSTLESCREGIGRTAQLHLFALCGRSNFECCRRLPFQGEAMSYSISILLTRNLHDVFGENHPARRRAAIDEVFTEDCVFYDPSTGVYRGRDEIDRVAGAIRATHPDFRYQPIAGPEELGNGGRIQWVSGRPGAAPAYAGTDFIIARDGRIAALYLFLDKLP